MFEISLATVDAIFLKVLWTGVAAAITAFFFLWPIDGKPVKPEAKVCFVVIVSLATAFIFDLIKVNA